MKDTSRLKKNCCSALLAGMLLGIASITHAQTSTGVAAGGSAGNMGGGTTGQAGGGTSGRVGSMSTAGKDAMIGGRAAAEQGSAIGQAKKRYIRTRHGKKERVFRDPGPADATGY